MSIRIMTAVHPGIYASQGGGTTTARAEASTGPRNLLRLAAKLADKSASATRSYGNVGHLATWLEIDGVRIDSMDVCDVLQHDSDIFSSDAYWITLESPTTKARALIARVASGAYQADQARIAAARESADYLQA